MNAVPTDAARVAQTGNSAPAEWKAMNDFAAGIDANRLPATSALVGWAPVVRLDDGTVSRLDFLSGSQVAWSQESGDAPAAGRDWYEAIEVRKGVYFIDQTFADTPNRSTVTVLNMATRRVLAITSVIGPATPGKPRVRQTFTPGVLDDGVAATGPTPAPTRDLVGWRALYRYSPNHLYEHVYLSTERYAWQCLIGEQRGHGDVDLTSTWKFDEGLYVFTFREFKIAVAATWLYDFAAMRSTGKFFGIGADDAINNSPGGAFITELNRTTYPPDGEPV